MLYEHTMLFRLTTPPEAIQNALLEAREIAHQPLQRVEQEKRRERIRGVGNGVMRAVSFEFTGDEVLMEVMRDRLWEGHDVVSTLTIEHPEHIRVTPQPRWEAAVEHWFQPGPDRPVYGQRPQPARSTDRFSKDALMDRFLKNDPKARTFTPPSGTRPLRRP